VVVVVNAERETKEGRLRAMYVPPIRVPTPEVVRWRRISGESTTVHSKSPEKIATISDD
jgi:hypothetical protein